ncbi:nuclease-related domain-containing protein [Demequina sp.]|uniref:nuclease-related domain-containing protein n=1 Tax=Demequina sp. TaxID=2050685 RepID=UPI0025BD81AC|nr:nuclease-related domain-containing protein [Demequina sp.]
MTDITITRWTKYGHRRGYATAADGAKLGWIDLKTGAVTIEDGADAVAVTAALEAWGGTPAPAATASEPTPEPTWTDLATRRPGQLVREQAAVAWESSKDRSKILAYGARVFNVHTDERAWRVGADGEEAVGARLEKLRDRGWYLLHSVPVGKKDSDIDHVAIGPGGAFTLNTKNHPGGKIWVAKYQMRVNGHVVPYLRNASHEATRASKLLTKAAGFEVSVRSCVVVLTGSIVPEVNIKQMPDDVMVLDRMDVPRWFKKRPAVLTPEQVEAIYAAARRSDTWV